MSIGGENDVLPAGGGGTNLRLGLGGNRKRYAFGSDTGADSKNISVSSGSLNAKLSLSKRIPGRKRHGQLFCEGS